MMLIAEFHLLEKRDRLGKRACVNVMLDTLKQRECRGGRRVEGTVDRGGAGQSRAGAENA